MQKYKLYTRIRDLREDKDMTQAETAKIIKAGTTQYRRYESAETAISLEQAEIFADYYNVSLDYIAGRTNDKRGLTRSELSDDETMLIKKYRSLSKGGRCRLLERLDVISEMEEDTSSSLKGAI